MRRRATSFLLTALLAHWLSGQQAWADVTVAPPSTCPPGTRAFSNHVTRGCAPDDCSGDASCRTPGEVCALHPLCVHRWETRSPYGTTSSAEVDGPCHLGLCRDGFTCELRSRCVPAGLARSGCTSLLSGNGLSTAAFVLPAVAALLALGRALARRKARSRG